MCWKWNMLKIKCNVMKNFWNHCSMKFETCQPRNHCFCWVPLHCLCPCTTVEPKIELNGPQNEHLTCSTEWFCWCVNLNAFASIDPYTSDHCSTEHIYTYTYTYRFSKRLHWWLQATWFSTSTWHTFFFFGWIKQRKRRECLTSQTDSLPFFFEQWEFIRKQKQLLLFY